MCVCVRYVEVTREEEDEDEVADFLEIERGGAPQMERLRGATAAFLWSGDDHKEEGGESVWGNILNPDETIVKMGKVKKYVRAPCENEKTTLPPSLSFICSD